MLDDPKPGHTAGEAALEGLATDCVRRIAPILPEGVGYAIVLYDRKGRCTMATTAASAKEVIAALIKVQGDERQLPKPGAPRKS